MFKQYQPILCLLLAACVTCVSGLDFTGAQWIWTPGRDADGTYPAGNVAFRRDFSASDGRIPVSANILVTSDNAYTLYVNGLKLGQGGDFRQPQRYCVPLVKDCNLFAVSAQNYDVGVNNPAGLLAAIQIRFTDGSTETIFTDEQWRVVGGTPAGFEQNAFDDSKWSTAFVEGPYPDAAPWNNPIFSLSIPPENQFAGRELTFQTSKWIWTHETTGPLSPAPIGARAFRKTIVTPNGQLTSQARIIIAADNQHTLYVNGMLVGSGASFTVAQRYIVNFPPTERVVIAVFAKNIPPGGPASLIVAAELVTCDCAENVYFVSDGSWKYSIGTPANFIQPDFDDSKWPQVFIEGGEGVLPWGPTKIPTANSPQSAALSGAPAAPPASVAA